MSKYVITGSLGHISQPIVKALVAAGHQVAVVTSSADKTAAIQALGATALVGSVYDPAFVSAAFAGAGAVYTMIPPNWAATDWLAAQAEVARNYAAAIQAAGVKYVVNLSSIGAHLGTGAGPVDGLAHFEQLLNALPGVNVAHLRPSFFYYNLFSQIPLLKHQGILGNNFGGGPEKLALVHTDDIAAVATQKLLALDFGPNEVTYISSDERTGAEIAQVLGQAVGQPAAWVEFTDEQAYGGMTQAGLSPTHAQGYTELGRALRTGAMQADYWQHTPARGQVKLEQFAQAFRAAYQG
jgi:uncharacterized protein YbjT (DUF2867 family)